MTKKQNEGWDDISKEDSSRKPITAFYLRKDAMEAVKKMNNHQRGGK